MGDAVLKATTEEVERLRLNYPNWILEGGGIIGRDRLNVDLWEILMSFENVIGVRATIVVYPVFFLLMHVLFFIGACIYVVCTAAFATVIITIGICVFCHISIGMVFICDVTPIDRLCPIQNYVSKNCSERREPIYPTVWKVLVKTANGDNRFPPFDKFADDFQVSFKAIVELVNDLAPNATEGLGRPFHILTGMMIMPISIIEEVERQCELK